MTPRQIQCFLTAARCLNFTTAAKQLYISQPALSRIISTIEEELNLTLFVRHKNRLRLTPAAVVLMQELPGYEQLFDEIIEKARTMNAGGGQLRVGIIGGQPLPRPFKETMMTFRSAHPEVTLQFFPDSFSGLREALDQHRADLILTADWDIEKDSRYLFETVCENPTALVVSRYHPAAKREVGSLDDLKDEHFILTGKQESSNMLTMFYRFCRQAGFEPEILTVNTPEEQMLLVDTAQGIGVTNQNNYMVCHPDIKTLDLPDLSTGRFVLAWRKDNVDVNIALFTNFVIDYLRI
ncbi:MAG: LysR family transcriptional regulator [Clostridiales bacterium]|nr:LysR family transcriptional regulator [Clostridiales bacterium]